MRTTWIVWPTAWITLISAWKILCRPKGCSFSQWTNRGWLLTEGFAEQKKENFFSAEKEDIKAIQQNRKYTIGRCKRCTKWGWINIWKRKMPDMCGEAWTKSQAIARAWNDRSSPQGINKFPPVASAFQTSAPPSVTLYLTEGACCWLLPKKPKH